MVFKLHSKDIVFLAFFLIKETLRKAFPAGLCNKTVREPCPGKIYFSR